MFTIVFIVELFFFNKKKNVFIVEFESFVMGDLK